MVGAHPKIGVPPLPVDQSIGQRCGEVIGGVIRALADQLVARLRRHHRDGGRPAAAGQ
jgi:hypothetical protein